MKASFWKALEALGAGGAAACDWQRLLGPDGADCARFLRPTGRTAESVMDPCHPPHRLQILPDGERDFVAMDDEGWTAPNPLKVEDVVELEPHWEPIAQELAGRLQFDYGAWDNKGDIRRIGSCQDPFGRVSPVLLFLPPGALGDWQVLFRELSTRTGSTVFLPTARWLTTDLEALRVRNHLEFLILSERLAQLEGEGPIQPPLPTIVRPTGASSPSIRPIIHATGGLRWSQIRIEIAGNQSIRLHAPGQEALHTFSKREKLRREHPLGVLMTLAAHGQWQNPPKSSPDYGRTCKAFQRLQQLLCALVPLPGKPFRRQGGAYMPLVHVRLNATLVPQRQ